MEPCLTHRLVIRALDDALGWDGGLYAGLIGRSLQCVRPSFESDEYRDNFREHSVDRRRFASVLASNLYMEGYSAGRLKQYAGVVPDQLLRRNLLRHAEDEARHSRHFFDLLFAVFPELDAPSFRAEAEARVVDLGAVTPCPPDYPEPSRDEILNSLILMNLFEVKALFLVNYLKPFAVAHAHAVRATEVASVLERIAKDESHHIAYTAKHIDHIVREHGEADTVDLIAGFTDQMNRADDFQFSVPV